MNYDKETIATIPVNCVEWMFKDEGSFIDGISTVPKIRSLVSNIDYRERSEELENDESILQLIPYVVTMNSYGQIFAYQRGGETSEGRLTGNWSIGVGGHIKEEDGLFAGERETEHLSSFIIVNNIERELSEEMGKEFFKRNYSFYFGRGGYTVDDETFLKMNTIGMIYDKSNPVGRVHLGIVVLISILATHNATLDKDSEFVQHETDTRWLKLPPECDDAEVVSKFETWSKIAYEKALLPRFAEI